MGCANSPFLHAKLDSILGKMFYSLVSQPGNVFGIKNEVQTAAKHSILKQNVDVNAAGALCKLPPAKSHNARAPLRAEKPEKLLPSSGGLYIT